MSARAIRSADPKSWVIVWRVVATRAGSYNHDMVFIETQNEGEARQRFRGLRQSGYPVRLERVQCGPLPRNGMLPLARLRAASPQNAGEDFPKIAGACFESARGFAAKHLRRA